MRGFASSLERMFLAFLGMREFTPGEPFTNLKTNRITGTNRPSSVNNVINVKNTSTIRLLAILAVPTVAGAVSAQPRGEFYTHGEPTAHEQLMLEWVNAARANPLAEMQRLGIGLNDGLAAGQITPTPKQPLAFNPKIIEAARAHSRWMLATNTFSHTGVDGTRAANRMANAGYPFVAPFGWYENVSWRGNTAAIDITETTRSNHDGLMRSPGHRVNLFADRADEAGFGIIQGTFVSGRPYNANMVTQNFAQSAGSPTPNTSFLTGVVFRDANRNGLYDVGEGVSGVTITTSAESHHTVTSTSGGYAVPVAAPAGGLVVRANGNGIDTERVVDWTGVANVKVDFVESIPVAVEAPLPDDDGDGIANGMDLFSSSAPKTPIHANTYWEWTPPVDLAGANRFEAKGLPSGLKLNPATGTIAGLPNKPGSYSIQVRARHGNTWGQWQSITLAVQSWPAHATGSFVGLVGRDGTLNASLGGLLQVSTTGLGQLTGSLRLGGQSLSLRGTLQGDPGETITANISLPRRGLSPLSLALTWDSENGFSGSLGDGTTVAGISGWKKTWDAKTNPAPLHLRGQFNAMLSAGPGTESRPVPQGFGWSILRVDAAGIANIAGKTADGTTFTSALPLGPGGEIALWTLPGKVPASLMGQAEISGNHLDGELGWVKLPQAGRTWPQGFGQTNAPVVVSMKGSRYFAPAPGTALATWNLPAAYPNALARADGSPAFSFAVNPNGAFAVGKAGTPANPNGARISFNAKDGRVAGSWSLVDADPNKPGKVLKRTLSFEGIIVQRDDVAPGSFASGFYSLPALPVAGQNPNATLLTSGAISLGANIP